MRKTKIVATIGPSSQDKETLIKMIDAGLNVVRLNSSHGSLEYHRGMIGLFKEIRKEKKIPFAILVDLEGPKMRTGDLKTEYVELKEGEKLILTNEDILGDDKIIPLHYKNLPYEVKKGDRILMSDGLIELEVLDSKDGRITTLIKNGGKITHRRGLNVPGIDIQLPPLTDKDKKFLQLALEEKVDYVAQSFVRKASDLKVTKNIMKEYGHYIPIISKIETMQAMMDIESIIDESDGIMVARGDLGVELPPQDVPIAQKKIIKICNIKAKPVITATQMLESMINNPRPTRAETSDVANAIID
jgi:pyruvate kinase